jgi:hypothetical protein
MCDVPFFTSSSLGRFLDRGPFRGIMGPDRTFRSERSLLQRPDDTIPRSKRDLARIASSGPGIACVSK